VTPSFVHQKEREKKKKALNMALVPALSPFFGFSPCAFFCLASVPAVCKKFVISPYVNFKLEKMLKLTVCHVDQLFHATWHTKRQNFQNRINKIK